MIVNANSIVQHVSQIKNEIIKHVGKNNKGSRKYKKGYSWNPRTCICENSKYLKSIPDNSVIKCVQLYLLCILYKQE